MRLPSSSTSIAVRAQQATRAVAVSAPPAWAAEGEPDTVTLPEPVTDTQLAHPWQVVVYDDPINLQSYVVYVFQTLFGYPREKATQLMLEVHHQGKSLVATADREKAEYYVGRLHGYGLQATMERATPDKDGADDA